ncbi:hypothetical protein M153_236000166 [Pseudoloma neurophilia]|uniref:Uncharacterized protein n=1 Tax=Pseudoloma neurophilia TaxID=146866 RepID=A0A0R0LYV0_9MICR|nr:hypothetical protein M153_236000166 [Pseudoloma neurophilia]
MNVIDNLTDNAADALMKEMFFDGRPNILKIKFANEGPEKVDLIITQIQ